MANTTTADLDDERNPIYANRPSNGHSNKKRNEGHTRINSRAFINLSNHMGKKDNHRLVVVRYYLDRPGYDLQNSAARLWFHPPVDVRPVDVKEFLENQGIALPGLLVEVYLDLYKSFMLLEACEASCIEWDFEHCSYRDPGVLNIRLTDLSVAEDEQGMTETEKKFPDAKDTQWAQPQYANPTASGLFSFSMMVGLETAALLGKLIPGSVDPVFALAHGPYMVFVGGFMQILVACFNVLRNNLYGATAFFGFGSFWFANGLSLILNLYFVSPESEASYLLDNSDPWGVFFRSLFVFCFTGALLKQTLVMSRLSTILIFLLLLKVGAQAFTGWSVVFQWIQLVVGTLTSVFAFYVFLVDFTNGVYHREVFNPHKWSSEHSPEEVFGAAGRSGTLFSKAARLRQAQFPDVPRVRAAMDKGERQLLSQRLVTPSHKRTVSLPGTRNADETSQPAVNTLAE